MNLCLSLPRGGVGPQIAPDSPRMLEGLATALMNFAHKQDATSAAQHKEFERAHNEGIRIYDKLTAQRVDDMHNAQHCFELSGVRMNAGDLRDEIRCLSRAVELEPGNAGYANNLFTKVMAFSTEEIDRLHKQYGSHSRNAERWHAAPKDRRMVPLPEWLAGYPGALDAAAYTTAALLGPGYRSGDGGGGISNTGENHPTGELAPAPAFAGWYSGSDLRAIVDSAGARQTEVRAPSASV
jgi:hypothetical protein